MTVNHQDSRGLKIKRNDWLLVDTCQQAANHAIYFKVTRPMFIFVFSYLDDVHLLFTAYLL